MPILTRRDVAAELKAIHGVRHRSLHTAFFGEADPDLLSNRVVVAPVEGSDARFQVEEVSSELHLRRALATAAPDTALALLLTYGDRVPLDVEARLARGGVRHIDRGRRLAARFEARSVSPDLLAQKPLVDALLDLGRAFGKYPGLTVDLDAGWRAFLGELTPLGGGPPSEDGVLTMAVLRTGGPAFAKRCQDWPGLRESLHAWLLLAAGPVAKIAWRAWEADEGLKAGALTFLLQACAEGLGAGRHAYVRGLLRPVLEQLDPDLRDAFAAGAPFLRRWGGLADRLWLALQGIPGAAGDVLRAADDVLPREPEVDEALAPSPYLPRALALVRQRLAAALTSAAQAPDRALVEAAMAAEKRFADHRLAQVEAERPALERARMALRLLAWRHRRAQGAEAIEARPPVEQAPAIAAAYAQEGGFVDRARQTLRGSGLDEFGKACAAVLDGVDALRDAQDERFARALDAWTSRGRPPSGALPIEAAIDELAVKFLAKSDRRRLLVVLMDGMSWERCVELLLDLEQHGFAPIGEHFTRGLRPVMAAIPTVTDVSRSAFFAGKLPRPGEALSASGDVQRFAGHKGLQKLGLSPRLLLGGDAVARDGAATAKALDLVRSDERVVGVVLNAIDDQLSAGGHLKVTLGFESIPALRDLLRAAQFAGRAVLLAADHGHVPGARFGSPVAKGDGSTRWRSLAAGEQPGPREVALGGAGVWRPPGVERVALLYAESDCYGSGPREGEHGGTALAEVVAPAVLIAADELARQAEAEGVPDPGLEVRPLPRPTFWDLSLGPVAPTVPVASGRKREPRPAPVAELTLSLPSVATPVPAATPVPTPSPAVVELVSQSKMLSAMLAQRPRAKRDEVLRAVTVLAEAGGTLSPELFAARFGALSVRVPGLVSVLSEVLNVDGYPVLLLDHAAKVVRLDLGKLEAVFKG